MKDLVQHASTARQIGHFLKNPSHAVILAGPIGSGKSTVASSLAEAILEIDQLREYPYKLVIASEEGKAVSIEAVRQLEHFLSLKVPRKAAYNRVVIVGDAHLLTIEAQNALLKTLEEPPEGTLVILNAANLQALLPTVRSRSQIITIQEPSKEVVSDYFSRAGYSEEQISQAYAISAGLPGLMQALLDDTEHPLLQATDQARSLLQASAYERLLKVDELSKQKTLALDTVFILQQMARVSLLNPDSRSADRWQRILAASYEALESLQTNAQSKLVLDRLCLSL